MAKLLYIESSPRKDRSTSIEIAKEFLRVYEKTNPDDEIEILDLWSASLPEFDGDTINAKYRILHGQEHTPKEADAWGAVVNIFEQFNAAQKYLFSVPMWNFSIPYRLKHYIDVLTQPGLTFSYSPESGYSGLVTAKPAVVVYARGGEYSSDATVKSFDFQRPYLEMWLGFIGFTDIRPIVIEPTLADSETVDTVRASALRLATDTAQNV